MRDFSNVDPTLVAIKQACILFFFQLVRVLTAGEVNISIKSMQMIQAVWAGASVFKTSRTDRLLMKHFACEHVFLVK